MKERHCIITSIIMKGMGILIIGYGIGYGYGYEKEFRLK